MKLSALLVIQNEEKITIKKFLQKFSQEKEDLNSLSSKTKKTLTGHIVVITGGAGEIGKATAIAFHNEGAKVYATDINDQTLESLNKEYPNIKVNNLDSTNKKAVEEFSTSD